MFAYFIKNNGKLKKQIKVVGNVAVFPRCLTLMHKFGTSEYNTCVDVKPASFVYLTSAKDNEIYPPSHEPICCLSLCKQKIDNK